MKILYLSCHSILEYDEVILLRELGHHVFTPGSYVDEQNHGRSDLRPDLEINTGVYAEDWARYCSFGHHGHPNKDCLSRQFVSDYDLVIVMHLQKWIHLNWENIRHKPVIWRTIGQSTEFVEKELEPYRKQGLRIVRYSPAERNLIGFLGEDALVRFSKDPAEFEGWTGAEAFVMTLSQVMPQRAEACHYKEFMETTRGFPTRLYGPGNHEAGPIDQGEVTYGELKAALKKNRSYLYTGTLPASYTLNFMEAWMTGIPTLSIGSGLWHGPHYLGQDIFEVPHLIRHGVDGFFSDDIQELRSILKNLLSDTQFAGKISMAGRQSAIRHFGKEAVKEQWRSYLKKLEWRGFLGRIKERVISLGAR